MVAPGGAAIVSDPKPAFLKVLCILTFVGAGLAFFKNVFTLVTFSATKASMQAFSSVNSSLQNFSPKTPFSMFSMDPSKVKAFLNWTFWGGWIGLLASLATLAGALLMWNLRRSGFFIYIVAEIAVFFSAFMMLIASSGMKLFGIQSLIMSILVMIFTAGFSVMYSLNLKHLK